MINMEILESQLRQIFASVVWTHKIQEKQADIYLNRYNNLEFLRILLAAITSSGIFATIFVDKFWLKVVTTIVSAISLFITTYFKSYNLKELQKQHKKSALEWLELREDIMAVLCDIPLSKYSQDDLIAKRDTFIKRKIEIAKTTLDVEEKAVKKASNALKITGDNNYSDAEIDSFLPPLARKYR